MQESDDTDHLLGISPNSYLKNNEKKRSCAKNLRSSLERMMNEDNDSTSSIDSWILSQSKNTHSTNKHYNSVVGTTRRSTTSDIINSDSSIVEVKFFPKKSTSTFLVSPKFNGVENDIGHVPYLTEDEALDEIDNFISNTKSVGYDTHSKKQSKNSSKRKEQKCTCTNSFQNNQILTRKSMDTDSDTDRVFNRSSNQRKKKSVKEKHTVPKVYNNTDLNEKTTSKKIELSNDSDQVCKDNKIGGYIEPVVDSLLHNVSNNNSEEKPCCSKDIYEVPEVSTQEERPKPTGAQKGYTSIGGNYFENYEQCEEYIKAFKKRVLGGSTKPYTLPVVATHKSPSQVIDDNGNLATNEILNLSQVFGDKNEQQVSTELPPVEMSADNMYKLEFLRRMHLEKAVNVLQSKLLTIQQRLTIAVNVDEEKKSIIEDLQFREKNAQMNCKELHCKLEQLSTEHDRCNEDKMRHQQELFKALNVIKDFEEKLHKIRTDSDFNNRKQEETICALKEEIGQLREQVANNQDADDQFQTNLKQVKSKLIKCENINEKLREENENLVKENNTLKNQKETLQTLHGKQKLRADTQETRAKNLQEELQKLEDKYHQLEKKLATQQKYLKSQYQQQLDQVVVQKLQEFQEQLNKSEEKLKMESREREVQLAERAVRQLDDLNEKNQLEVKILEQKHKEEEELSRLQLANANQRIKELEEYLECYKARRTEIAGELHKIMESQWRKALKILVKPSDVDELNFDNISTKSSPVDSPKSSKCTSHTVNEENESECAGGDNCPLNQDSISQKRLQKFMDMLLSKSPERLSKIDDLMGNFSIDDNKGLYASSSTSSKLLKKSDSKRPPWKA